MLKRAQIQTLLVTQTDNGEELIRTTARGGCLIDERGVMLRYAEEENAGTATLIAADGLADLRRDGRTVSRMTFIDGRLMACPYRTEAGEMDMSIFTHAQQLTVHAAGGCFRARYSLLLSGRQVADNVLTVEWTFE